MHLINNTNIDKIFPRRIILIPNLIHNLRRTFGRSLNVDISYYLVIIIVTINMLQ